MKILHTADLHLASPMETHLSPKKAKLRRAELRKVFSDLVHIAKAESVAAVLLCGDIADISDLHGEYAKFVLETLADLAPTPVLIVRGNHDPMLFSGAALPENVTLFSDAWQTVYIKEDDLTVSVSARELPMQTVSADTFMAGHPSAEGTADVHITMLHGALADTLTFGGEDTLLSRKALVGQGIDYLALGHIHAYVEEKIDRTCVACYSGCLAGRGFDECGEKGYVMLDIAKRADGSASLMAEFRKMNARVYHHVYVDVSTLAEDFSALEHAVENALVDIPDDDIVRLELVGEEAPDTLRDLSVITARMEERFFAFQLRDSRTVKIDMEALSHDVSLKGVFVKNVLSSDLSDEDKAAVIRMGIGALRGT